jgi:hypothetical protein
MCSLKAPIWQKLESTPHYIRVFGIKKMQEVLQLIGQHEENVSAYNRALPYADTAFTKKLIQERDREIRIIASLRKLIV